MSLLWAEKKLPGGDWVEKVSLLWRPQLTLNESVVF
jgi:hypothetical protein